ncbi:MAG: HisA/HisF-related TIM barrel protein [Pyrinomonadaceae bacterium]
MIKIIPAMDIIGGKCVRLTQGDFSRATVYSDDPLETAKQFAAAGLTRLHVVDLDGARLGAPANLHVLKRVASGTSLTIDYGGGVKSDDDVAAVFDAGAAIINVGSIAVRQRETFLGWLGKFGSEKFLLGGDSNRGKIAIDGWQTKTEFDTVGFLAGMFAHGVSRAFVTDIGSDGTMAGPSLSLYQKIRTALPDLKLIASGGVRSIEDIDELERIGCSGVIVGRALYEEKIILEDLTKYVG